MSFAHVEGEGAGPFPRVPLTYCRRRDAARGERYARDKPGFKAHAAKLARFCTQWGG